MLKLRDFRVRWLQPTLRGLLGPLHGVEPKRKIWIFIFNVKMELYIYEFHAVAPDSIESYT